VKKKLYYMEPAKPQPVYSFLAMTDAEAVAKAKLQHVNTRGAVAGSEGECAVTDNT
jgi:hypothetical protein